jgi:hypothetical protein
MAKKYYRGSKIEEDKLLPLLHEFELVEEFGEGKVIEVATRIQNINDISYIFRGRGSDIIKKELASRFINYCVDRGSK